MSLSSNSINERKMGNLYDEIRQLKHKIVYLTPEKLVKSPGLVSVISELY